MLGLTVNSFIEASDFKEYEVHRSKARTMDLNDIVENRLELNVVEEEPMPDLEDDDDDVVLPQLQSSLADPVVQELGEEDIAPLHITPLRVLPPGRVSREGQCTPIGYTGSSAGATQDVLPTRTSATEQQGTPGGCSTSSSPRDNLLVPKTERLDDIDQRSRPSLELFRDTRKKMRKTPYNELPSDAIIDVSDDDEGDMGVLGQFGMDIEANKRVKEESMSVAELNAKFERQMKEKMAEAAAENARKMSVIEDELRASNAKTDAILALLSKLTGSAQAPPPSYPFHHGSYPPPPYPPNPAFPGVPSYPGTPHPTPVSTPPPTPVPYPIEQVTEALQGVQYSRTSVRESSSPIAFQPHPLGVSPNVAIGAGHEAALRTGSASDAQASPNIQEGVDRMDIDVLSPTAGVEAPNLQNLDISEAREGVEAIPETQSSPAHIVDVIIEDVVERIVTDARSSIAEEGAALPSNDEAPPRDDEVTHL